ncbi:MAG: hypothetical protein IKB68_06495 [Rikenellaceae bacterium]|nr:hypothetical protein [Rikenellaceae bacterium]
MTTITKPTIETSFETYRHIAEELVCYARSRDFFRCKIVCTQGDIVFTFILNAFSYHENGMLTNIVPVWWECHTEEGELEYQNDFQFSELIRHIFGE